MPIHKPPGFPLEAFRPEQGYPLRLLAPGCGGNADVKWLRRISSARAPFKTREVRSLSWRTR